MALVVALLGGALILYTTEAMWEMDSPNAQSWNATFNTSATFGFNIIPIVIIVIAAAAVLSYVGCMRGY